MWPSGKMRIRKSIQILFQQLRKWRTSCIKRRNNVCNQLKNCHFQFNCYRLVIGKTFCREKQSRKGNSKTYLIVIDMLSGKQFCRERQSRKGFKKERLWWIASVFKTNCTQQNFVEVLSMVYAIELACIVRRRLLTAMIIIMQVKMLSRLSRRERS